MRKQKLGRRWKTLCVSAIALLAVGCTHVAERPTITSNDYIRLQRSPCFGACPVYDLTIFGDGNVRFVGIRFVDVTDTVYSKIGKTTVDSLFSELSTIHFFALDSNYWKPITDLPTTTVTVSVSGRMKEVIDYAGAPDELHAFEHHIDEATNVYQWIGHH